MPTRRPSCRSRSSRSAARRSSTSMRAAREIAAEELFVGPSRRARAGRAPRRDVWPLSADGEGFAFEEFAQRRGDYALAWPLRAPRRRARASSSGSVTDRARRVLEVDPESSPARRPRERRSSRGARPRVAAYQRHLSASSSSARVGAGDGRRPRDRRRRHRQRPPLPRGRRAAAPAVGLPAPPPRADAGRTSAASTASAVPARSASTAWPCARACCSPSRPTAPRSRPSRGSPATGELTPLQEAFRRHHALQCGFCTPGILIAAEDCSSASRTPTREEIADLLSGHLCRCTGYEPIVEAIARGRRTREPRAQPALRGRAHARRRGARREDERLTYAELRERAARIAGGLAARGVAPATASPASLANGPRPSSSTGPASGSAPSSCRSRTASPRPSSTYCVDGLRRRGRRPRAGARSARARRRRRAPGRARPRRARAVAPALHVRHDRPAEGRAALAPRRARRRRSRRSSSTATATAIARSGSCRSTTRWASTRCSRCSLLGGCFVAQPEWDPAQRAAADRARAAHPLYLAPTLFHDLVHAPAPRADADSRRVRARRLRGRGDDGRARRSASPRPSSRDVFVNHYGSTEIYTFSIHRDQGAKPGCAGRR